MRLEKAEFVDRFSLVTSPVEWKEVHALAQFAQAGIAYDARAAYAVQVFVYPVSQPQDILGNVNTLAAFAEVGRLGGAVTASGAGGEITLQLRKEEMRQLLVMLGKAAESEDQAEVVNYAEPAKFPYCFPDLEFPANYYWEAFYDLLKALHEDRSLSVFPRQ